jgi:plasmid stability protein
VKNVTLSIDEDTHRAARIVAAERGVSLSALVRDYLTGLRSETDPRREAVFRSLEAMDEVKRFSASNRMAREELHER